MPITSNQVSSHKINFFMKELRSKNEDKFIDSSPEEKIVLKIQDFWKNLPQPESLAFPYLREEDSYLDEIQLDEVHEGLENIRAYFSGKETEWDDRGGKNKGKLFSLPDREVDNFIDNIKTIDFPSLFETDAMKRKEDNIPYEIVSFTGRGDLSFSAINQKLDKSQADDKTDHSYLALRLGEAETKEDTMPMDKLFSLLSTPSLPFVNRTSSREKNNMISFPLIHSPQTVRSPSQDNVSIAEKLRLTEVDTRSPSRSLPLNQDFSPLFSFPLDKDRQQNGLTLSIPATNPSSTTQLSHFLFSPQKNVYDSSHPIPMIDKDEGELSSYSPAHEYSFSSYQNKSYDYHNQANDLNFLPSAHDHSRSSLETQKLHNDLVRVEEQLIEINQHNFQINQELVSMREKEWKDSIIHSIKYLFFV